MFGCHLGKLFQVTVAGGSYQEGLTTHIQGVPPGLAISEAEIYSDLLLRKPGQGELASPQSEDLIIGHRRCQRHLGEADSNSRLPKPS